jgi:alkylation response protein AidB-like acyl-CoA dehydrogenase
VDFEYTAEQLELREAARSVLEAACPSSLVRAVFEGGERPAALTERLVALDWAGLAIAEEHGGLGLGYLELGIVVEELGRAVAPTPLLATLTQLVPMLQESGRTERLPDVVGGTLTGTLAIAEGISWRPAEVTTTARPAEGGWLLQGTKDHVLDGATADELVVIARAEGTGGVEGLGAFLVPGAAVVATPRPGPDPTLPLATVLLDGVQVSADRVLLEPGSPGAAAAVHRALEQATTAMALSTVATCRQIFETTLQYAKDRVQFDRPIGSFQAIKHRLADCYLAVEKATALAYFAALTIAEDDPRRASASAMAKAAAGDCQRRLVTDGLQLHGGIGFTWEHDLHFLLKRAMTGDLLFGTAAAHRADLARELGLAS